MGFKRRGAFGDDLCGYYERRPVEMAEGGQARFGAEDPRMTVMPDDEKPAAAGHAPHAYHHVGDHASAHSDDAHGQTHSHEEHDWHSQSYVDYWIKRNEARAEARRPHIREMIALAKLPPDAALAVLDVGGGYGFVTEEVLRTFPRARVTLQDYSQLMLDRARERLEKWSGHMRYVLADLTDPAWRPRVGGPFDLIVSAIAIHNLRDRGAIAACYRAIGGLLKPGAPFLDYDLFAPTGGIETHIGMMQEAGMTRVSRAWDDGHAAIIVAHGRRAVP
jgi:SAM-dependent methyltransferase